MFDPGMIHLIEGANIDRPSNALTLTPEVHSFFGRFKIFFEAMDDSTHPKHTYKIHPFNRRASVHFKLPVTRTLLLSPNHTVDPPSSRLLALHQAIAIILNLSAAGEYIDRIIRDSEQLWVRNDGSAELAPPETPRTAAVAIIEAAEKSFERLIVKEMQGVLITSATAAQSFFASLMTGLGAPPPQGTAAASTPSHHQPAFRRVVVAATARLLRMAQPSPRLSSAGVLPISASATQKGSSPNKAGSKAAAPRLKLLVRRLPPGLTQEEFQTALGDEWKVGKGKVDWIHFKEGKVSKDPAKPSRPTRAYLRVTSLDLVSPLSEKVRLASFQDARNTIRDPVLLGPPSLEYAPYPRVPGSRVRKDGRQGTIDQDSDFIAFLESLTNPVTKPAVDVAGEDTKEEKPTITPLIQFLREKKANKSKDTISPAKGSRHHRGEGRDRKDGKTERVHAKKLLSRAEKATPPAGERQAKVEKATKEAVKAANKQVSNQSSKAQGKAAATRPPKEEPPVQTPPPERKRGNMSAATKILRRDLGLAPAGPRRRAEKAAAGEGASPVNESAKTASPSGADESKRPSTAKGTKEADTAKKSTPPAKQAKATPPSEAATARNAQKPANPPSGPAKFSAPSRPKQAVPQADAPPPTQSTATQAFLKHANPSQGVTEELLASGFATFGEVTKVEIDKKKGFGYVDFAEPESLRKAIQASPVQIAQSQVVVLERKSGAAVAQARGNPNHNRQNQPPTGPAVRVGGGGGGPAPPRHSRRGGGRGKGGFNKGGGGGNNAGGAGNAGDKTVPS
ncbi:hypothetical protein FQN50_008603 [Emmonsiellopsis sp. PD_5]|nr:hypothetical protein FQN50_008603 [Emmonsiellopsis sp. PD_5]